MKLKALFFTALLGGLFVSSLAARTANPATATLAADSTVYLPAGGTMTFTATTTYTGTPSAIGWTVNIPAGWAFVSDTIGAGAVSPSVGRTSVLEWAYIGVPASPATFTFTVSYPAGLTAAQNLASSVIVRIDGSAYTATPADVSVTRAQPPVITSDATATASYGSSFGYAIIASSVIPITGYSATGLSALGLSLDSATGAISGTPTATGTFPITLGATNAAGSGTANLSITVTQSNATIALTQLAQTYNGSPRPVTATTTPSGLTVALTYAGDATAPTAAGTYAVVGTIVDANYHGTTSDTLVVARAPQTISFTPVGAVQPGTNYTLAATASSALPVAFAVVSGPASVSGTTLTVNGAGAIVLRAAQAGNDNYLATTADQTVSASKLNQTITFPQPADKIATDPSFALVASASSSLPVTYTLVSGPAFLNSGVFTLTGSAGTIVVRASQAGNATYNAAPDVVRAFEVTADDDRVFFGDFFSSGSSVGGARGVKKASAVVQVGDIAAVLPAQSNEGTLLIVAPTAGINAAIAFTLREDGTFVSTSTQSINGVSQSVTVRGQLLNNVLSGTIDGLGFSFSTDVEPHTGPSAAAAGLYKSTALETSAGVTYTIIGANNNVLILAITPTLTIGGAATLTADGSFQLVVPATNTAAAVTLAGTIDQPSTTVASSITVADQPTVDFGGLKTTTSRTDRLINLSSRARVGSGEKLLITGFVIGGSTPKQVLVRAVGPGLAQFGVQGVLANPRIRIEQAGTLVAENDDWGTNADPAAVAAVAARVGAFNVASGSKDAMLLATLPPGVYSALVSGGDGVALAEIYDASENPQADYQRLVNISSRGEVTSGENVLIGGFVVTGNSPKKIMIRGVGPALAAQGIANALGDPLLKIFKNNVPLAQNDNWSADATAAAELTAAATTTGAFALTAGSKDAAIILTLAPGVYSVHVVGNAGTTGIALVEIYEVPEAP